MDQATVFIALGSNLQDRLKNLNEAVSQLLPSVIPVACSPIYETEPWGYHDQPRFLNQVIQATTDLSPEELLAYLKNIESQMGRKQTIRLGPRLIDLDILFYDNLAVNTPSLSIPHPTMHERAFVLVPLADLAPQIIHPVLNISVEELLTSVDRKGIRRFRSGGCE
ncbi:MAG: 2-amino-4-hydroxy-6-hydroxymethyldihydropteridine diphosphokinase [Anaerolineales bacterium]|nr:2-amino-4-hydroxy-6-hydroxymethyldihydropteridine diphosphokinase [Anaerolineales bacterium]